MGSSGGSDSKESTCSAGDLGFIPGLGRFPPEGNGNRLQYFCLENSMDREARRATVHGITKETDTTEGFTHTHTHTHTHTCHYAFVQTHRMYTTKSEP